MKLVFSIFVINLFVFNLKAQSNNDSISIYFNQKQYSKAANCAIKNNMLYKLDEFGFELYKLKDYENSLFFFLKAKENGKELYNDSDYKSLLEMIAYNYQELKDYNNAIKYFESAYTINLKIKGFGDESNISCIANLIVNYKAINNYKALCGYYKEVIKLQEKILGNNNPQCLKSINNLAYYYNLDGNFKEAERLYTQVLNIREETLGENNIDFVLSLSNLAMLYMDMGDYNKAEEFCIKSLSIRKKLLGEEDPSYAVSLNNLAEIYRNKGNYSKAETLFMEALEIHMKVVGENDPSYAITLNNLSVMYKDLGLYSKAETLNLKVLNIQRNNLGEENPEYAITLNNLAALYRDMRDYTKAESLYLQAISIQKKVLGEENPDYSTSLSNLAALYGDINNYSKAAKIYREVLFIQKKNLGDRHPDYANTLNNYAKLCASNSDFKYAESLYLQALSIRKFVLGENHPDYAITLDNLAQLYSEMGKINDAESLFYQALSIKINFIHKTFTFLNNQELAQILDQNLTSQYFYLSFITRNNDVRIRKQLADFSIFNKNAMFYKSELLDQVAKKNRDSIVLTNWQQYKKVRLKISQTLQEQIINQNALNQLKNTSDSLEKILMRRLPEFQKFALENNFGWSEIQKKIKSNEACVDFINFTYYNRHWTDTILYAAFITRPGWKEPQFVRVFNEEQLAILFDSSNSSLTINKIYSQGDTSYNSSLYNLIWKPIDSLLSGVKRVYISPSGLLNRVSFAAIPLPQGGRLIDRYKVEVLSNIRTLAEVNDSIEFKPKNMMLIGGVDYDAEPTISNTDSITFVSTDTSFSDLRSLHAGKWSFLPGAENEVLSIKNSITPSNIKLSILSGSNASEEAFKLIGNKNTPIPSIIHIATHGFAYPSVQKNTKRSDFVLQENERVFTVSEDALTRAGLVMAGGNKVWTSGVPYSNHEDGILTAREVSELNLKGCVLATLSACETGLGEIKGSEGVFGLQRAFKMAGVKYLIVSLWKVPDSQTNEFMQQFYSAWLIQKLPIRDAFRQTQISMSKRYPPYQWAAFVLME